MIKKGKTLCRYSHTRNQEKPTNNAFKYIPLEVWYIIFRFYLPDYEKYRLLFVCKKFNALIKRIRILPEKFSSKFRQKKYYFVVLNGIYYFGEADSFSIMNIAERKLNSSIRPIYHPKWRFDEKKFFMFSTTIKAEREKFFENYCIPIHYIQLENTISFPRAVGNIIQQNFNYENNRNIRWIHQKRGSTIINFIDSNFEIKNVYFYNKDLDPCEYIEIGRKISKLSRLIANSFATNFVLKCYTNFCIVDVLLAPHDRNQFCSLQKKYKKC